MNSTGVVNQDLQKRVEDIEHRLSDLLNRIQTIESFNLIPL